MKEAIKIPAIGESITEATIAEWNKKTGDYVNRNEILLVLETDKASVEVVAEYSGQLSTSVESGQTLAVGSIVGTIDTTVVVPPSVAPPPVAHPPVGTPIVGPPSVGTPPVGTPQESNGAVANGASVSSPPLSPPPPPVAAHPQGAVVSSSSPATSVSDVASSLPLSPSVRKIVAEKGLDPTTLQGSGKGGRLTKADVLTAEPMPSPSSTSLGSSPPQVSEPSTSPMPSSSSTSLGSSPPQVSEPSTSPMPQLRSESHEELRREPMSPLRKTIATRLVQAQQTAAILTTFNEIDMSVVMDLRRRYKEVFKEKYGVGLGFMGLFVKAVITALNEYPRVNASIDGDDIVYRNFVNMGIAVSTDRGLVVPVIRHADKLNLADIELSIRHYALKARDAKISIDDLSGGSFTISNGGVFGSLMSTPILNPPQSGILGLHKIEERPVALDGQVVVRPMMYVAFSYDHRVIDGKESVGFLVKVKQGLEDPSRLLLDI